MNKRARWRLWYQQLNGDRYEWRPTTNVFEGTREEAKQWMKAFIPAFENLQIRREGTDTK
jgi:hypothetical protein